MADAFPGTSSVPQPVPAGTPAPEQGIVTELQNPPTDPGRTLYLAKWSDRFFAWLIDFILIILFLNIVGGILRPFWPIDFVWDIWHWAPLELGFWHFFFFLYWTVFEGYSGQSLGKMAMNLKVVNRDGSRLRYPMAAVESLGKAFFLVLVIDCLIGWLAMPGTKLRLFNRISNTIVIKTTYREPEGVVYIREKE